MEQHIKFQDGESYEKWMGVWSQLVGDQFLRWLAPEQGKTWIDIGCGNGTFTEQIYNRHDAAEIHAIDPSREQIDFASKRIIDSNVSFQVGNALNLTFEADRFDYATMALVLFFVPDHAAGVAEMKRVVKPGGSISAYVWDLPGGGVPFGVINAQMRRLDIKQPTAPSAEISSMDRLEETWLEADLNEVEVTKISVDRTFENFEQFWAISYLSPPIGAVLSQLPAGVGQQVKKMTQEALAVDDNQPVIINGFANAIKGTA